MIKKKWIQPIINFNARLEVVIINIFEYACDINDFDEPTVYKDSEAIAQNLIHLLLLEPGTIQSHPNMGVGIVSKYRYMSTDQEDINKLIGDFRKQIDQYLPYQGVKVNGFAKNKIIYISAIIDGIIYAFSFDSEASNLQKVAYKKLNDL